MAVYFLVKLETVGRIVRGAMQHCENSPLGRFTAVTSLLFYAERLNWDFEGRDEGRRPEKTG